MIQKIKAEIEKKIKAHHDLNHWNAEHEFIEMLDFINSLEQEKNNVACGKPTKIKGWIARDAYDSRCKFHGNEKPKRYNEDGLEYWSGGKICYDLPLGEFMDISWDSEPLEVELTINRV